MKYMLPACLLFAFLISCENSDSREQQNTPAATNPLVPIFSDTSTKSNSGTSVALNPKHGEPGHRCDIAEGAPLPVTTTNIPSLITTPVTPTIIPTIPATKNETPDINAGSAGLNPKHGEPGHRCDIAVGAPLNSKPTQ